MVGLSSHMVVCEGFALGDHPGAPADQEHMDGLKP